MFNDFDFDRALEICKKYENEDTRNAVVVVDDTEIKQKLLDIFNLEDINNISNDDMEKQNLIICSLDEYNDIPNDILVNSKEFVI